MQINKHFKHFIYVEHYSDAAGCYGDIIIYQQYGEHKKGKNIIHSLSPSSSKTTNA